MVLVYFMQMVLKTFQKPEHKLKLHCSFLGSSSSVILPQTLPESLSLFFCTEPEGHFHPLFILSGFCLIFIHDLINVFPKETLKFLREKPTFSQYQQKDHTPKSILPHSLVLRNRASRSFHFQVPATTSSETLRF